MIVIVTLIRKGFTITKGAMMARYLDLEQMMGARVVVTLLGPPVSVLRGVLSNREHDGVWLHLDDDDAIFFIPFTAIQSMRFPSEVPE